MTVWCALMLSGGSFAQPHDLGQQIAGANTEISRQAADGAKLLDQLQAQLRELHEARSELVSSLRQIERRAAVHALGREFARTLNDQLRQLPRPEALVAARAAREQLLATTSDSNLRVERELNALRDLDAATSRLLAGAHPPIAAAQQAQLESAVRAELASQRDLLRQLDRLQNTILDALRETGEVDREFEQQVDAARSRLSGFLFWIPAQMGAQTVTGIVPALAWTVSPANWREAAASLGEALERDPLWPALALLAAAALLALRGRLHATLVSLAPAAVTDERYRIRDALFALAASLAIALPGPLALWTAGRLLATAPESAPFALALGSSLLPIAKVVLAVSAAAWLLERRGVAAGHFGWDEIALSRAVRALRSFARFFVPLMFIATLNGLEHAPYANRESLGRFCFSLAMIAVVVLLMRLLRRDGPLMRPLLAQAPRSWVVRLHGLWLWPLVAAPLAAAAFAGAGYFIAAGYLFGSMAATLYLAFGAALLYGLTGLWVQVQRARLSRRQAEVNAVPAQPAAAKEAGSEVAEPRPQRLDFAALGEQTRSLLNLLITLLLFAGVWWVWRDAVPALATLGRYAVWHTTSTVGGQHVVQAVTVDRLVLAILTGVVTVVGVRKAGALLDIVLLRRLEVQADATYAIKVMTSYALAGTGIVVAFGLLGVSWGDMQWLVAALGVGLGFGLQEIVANFASGLIVLAERPVRIGDVVTVGGISGTVWRIGARATTVVDFENKEIIIPNKAFITERVVNWTLSDQVTRLLLTVGVAYGSDIERVRQLLLGVLTAHPGVLSEPAPSVFMVSFGDSALNFELRVFVDSLDKRLRVQHEINVAVERALRENGFEIPFPQRDLHLRSGP